LASWKENRNRKNYLAKRNDPDSRFKGDRISRSFGLIKKKDKNEIGQFQKVMGMMQF